MLGDFTVKNAKLGKGNRHLTENRLSRNETWCAADNHNYKCHIRLKAFLDSNFNQAVIDKISNFHKIFTYSQKIIIFKVKLELSQPNTSTL